MPVRRNSVKQKIKTAAEQLGRFTRPLIYQRVQNLVGKRIPEQTMKREFTYLVQMGYIVPTKKTNNNRKVYEYTSTPTIHTFFN
jgi:hypothetical protein